MLGTIVNVIAIICGGTLGLFLKKGIPERLRDTVMKGLGLCVLYVGITGAIKGEKTLAMILSIVLGALIGEGIGLDDKLTRLGKKLEERFKKDDSENSIAEGFVTASLLFCVGALAIVGPLQGGLEGNYETLYTKSMIDGISAMIFASSLGVGVLFSAVLVFLYQGSITLLATWIAPYLNDVVIREMTCVGSLLIIGLAFNMLGITKLKVMNYLPGIFISIILAMVM